MLIRHNPSSDDEQWAPVADLMAVVMLVFMLIAMILSISSNLKEKENRNLCDKIYGMLDTEFSKDFKKWGARLAKDLTIHFTNEQVHFGDGEDEITPKGKDIIKEFFPRYMTVIDKIRKDDKEEILAIRIDGHTSTKWGESDNKNESYIKNLELSQGRARNVVGYVLTLSTPIDYKNNVKELVTANGLSSSKTICYAKGRESESKSRRVEFKLLTNSCQKAGVYEKEEKLIKYCSQRYFDES